MELNRKYMIFEGRDPRLVGIYMLMDDGMTKLKEAIRLGNAKQQEDAKLLLNHLRREIDAIM